MNRCEYEGPPVPDHRSPGLGPAGTTALLSWIESELARLDREKQILLEKRRKLQSD